MLAFIQEHWGVIAALLLALSEVLALIPGIKSSSIFQLIYNNLKALLGKKSE